MSKKLVTIKCDVKIPFKLTDTRFVNFNQDDVVALFSELEFKSLLPRLQILSSKQAKGKSKEEQREIIIDKYERNIKKFKYHLIQDDKEFKKFFTKLKQQKEFAFDTETASFDTLSAELLGISFSWKAGVAYYLEVRSNLPAGKAGKLPAHHAYLPDSLASRQAGAGKAGGEVRSDLFNYKDRVKKGENVLNPWLEKLKPILENKNIKKFGHNIKYDIKVMACYEIKVQGIAVDTMIASYLLNPGTRQHNLDALTFSEFGHQKITKTDLMGSTFAKATADKKGVKRKNITFADVPIEKLYNYSCEDADFTYRLAKKLMPELKKQKLDKLFNEIEMPLVIVLAQMETSGIKIDSKFLAKISQNTKKKIKQLEIKIYKQAGKKFNINSTQQLREVLYEKLNIPTETVSKTKTGLSTAADELTKLKDLHPIIKLIQQYRELVKLSTTYIDALPKLVNKQTGRLHTSFNQSVTATGRLSSTEPNLQNIPIRTALGREIRQAFIAEPGYKLLSLDYSQIELRLAAHMSGDKKMIKAFLDNADIHTMTAAEINQVSPSQVDREMRRQAKAINFGILYGQGPHGLSQTADIPYWRAKEFIEEYFIVYKEVKKFIDKSIASARKKGYAETLFNRRRYLPEINSSVMQVRKAAERMAINMPLQGTAADMIKIAMIEIYSRINREYKTNTRESDVKMLLQVHDELLFEVKSDKVDKVAGEIKKIMENVIKLKVPVIVDAKVGSNWREMKEVKS